jgi:hypothetical protein
MASRKWRRAFIATALENASYREKLALVIDEARCMHLSEREAAAQFGDVVAACLTVQKKVRDWILERKRSKDHQKIKAKTEFGFASYSRPDRHAERLRDQQRNQHGWRAPLNKPYAQLGSSITDPLSEVAGVHTALARKPVGSKKLSDDQKYSIGKVIALTPGVAHDGCVPKLGEVTHFSVEHEDPSAHLVVSVDSKDGDADIFISCDPDKPTLFEHTWASSGMGSDRIEIRPDDPKFAQGRLHGRFVGKYNVAVYGGGGTASDVHFTIRAHNYTPVGGPNARFYEPYGHSEGHAQARRFAAERRRADRRREHIKYGQPATVLMARNENPEPSTAPLTALRRLDGLSSLSALATAHISSRLPSSNEIHAASRVQRPGRCASCRHLLADSPPKSPSEDAAAAPAAAAAGSHPSAEPPESSAFQMPSPSKQLTAPVPSHALTSQAEVAARRGREARFREQAEVLLSAFAARLAFAVESNVAESGVIPTDAHLSATGELPPYRALQPGLTAEWVAHALTRVGVPLVLAPGTRLWAVGDKASYVAFLTSGELTEKAPVPSRPQLGSHRFQLVPTAAAPAGPAATATPAAAAAPAPAVAAPAVAVAPASTTAPLRRSSGVQFSKEVEEDAHLLGPGSVIGDGWLQGARTMHRSADIFVAGDSAASVLVLPLAALHKLKAVEPEAFEAIVRLICVASAAMRANGALVSHAADEWAALASNAHRIGRPIFLGAAVKATLQQAHASLASASSAITTRLMDLVDQGWLEEEEEGDDDEPQNGAAPASDDANAPASAPVGAPAAATVHRPRTSHERLQHEPSGSASNSELRPATAPMNTAVAWSSAAALPTSSSRGPLLSSASMSTLGSSGGNAATPAVDDAGTRPPRPVVMRAGMGGSAAAESLSLSLSGAASDAARYAFGTRVATATPLSKPPEGRLQPSHSMPAIRHVPHPVLSSAEKHSASVSNFFRRRDASVSRRQLARRTPPPRFGTDPQGVQARPPMAGVPALGDAAHKRVAETGFDQAAGAVAGYNSHLGAIGVRQIGAGELRAANQEAYYRILAETAIAVDEQLQKPGPRTLVRRERDRRLAEEAERRRDAAEAAAAQEAEREAAAQMAREAEDARRQRVSNLGRRGVGATHVSSGTQHTATSATAVAGGVDTASSVDWRSSRPGSPGGESSAQGSSAHYGRLGNNTYGGSLRPGTAPTPGAAAPSRRSSQVQATRIALRVSAFDQLRRQANQELRQELDRYADERLERFRHKIAALDVRNLSTPGLHDPARAMTLMRKRAAATYSASDA